MWKNSVLTMFLTAVAVAGCRRPPEPYCCTRIGYEKAIEEWRAERVAKLKAEGGWLRLAGLFWLQPGESRLGSDPTGEIVLPDRAPGRIGILEMAGDAVELTVEPDVDARHDGKPVDRMELRSDADGERKPDRVRVGDFTFFVIERGGRLALRLLDAQADALVNFRGLDYFPVDQRFKAFGRFVPYAHPRVLPVSTVIQTTVEATIPGEVIFEVDGQEYKLLPIAEPGDDKFFFVFADKTNGEETYGGGRFLVADVPKRPGDQVELDFNKATNPPCAFTHFATCPVPRKDNRLPIRVTAGEKRYVKPGSDHRHGQEAK